MTDLGSPEDDEPSGTDSPEAATVARSAAAALSGCLLGPLAFGLMTGPLLGLMEGNSGALLPAALIGVVLWSIIVARILTLSSVPRRRAHDSEAFVAYALAAGFSAAVNVFLAYEGLVGLGELGR
jgi:predicted lipid-binding transport protein (Tim44 family)